MKMTLCDIHEDFRGSQDGVTVEQFVKGSQVELSEYLLSCIDKSWAAPVGIQNKAVVIDGSQTGKLKRKG